MKATVRGVQVEGTPQEIAELLRALGDDQSVVGADPSPDGYQPPSSWKVGTRVTETGVVVGMSVPPGYRRILHVNGVQTQ